MLDRGGLRVSSSTHAAEQAQARFKLVLGGRTHREARAWVEEVAYGALTAGRRARREPRWVVREGNGYRHRGRLPQQGTWRYLWDEGEQVCLLARHGRDLRDPTKSVWVVVTVLRRRSV